MVQTIAADQLTLYDLEQKFQLRRVHDRSFFPEWETVAEVSAMDVERLERVKQHYIHLTTRPMLEGMVKMVIISPLLDLAGFFDAPFYSTSESSINLTAKDGKLTVRGKMDVLVMIEQFWVLVIESKRAEFSLKVGIPQVLTYMLASPRSDRPIYGMVSNGSNFTFLKLTIHPTPQYAQSEMFDIERGSDLSRVLQILNQLAKVAAQNYSDFSSLSSS